MSELATRVDVSPFDALRHEDERGEFWSARDLMTPLQYGTWQRFQDAIERARVAIRNAGDDPDVHISGAANMRKTDYRLTRYGAYMVAMNGDPRKPAIAEAQRYFAIKTRQAEVVQALTPAELILAQAQRLVETERAIATLERQRQDDARAIARQSVAIAEHGARLDGIEHSNGWFNALAFARKQHLRYTDNATLNSLGRRAAKLCRDSGIEPRKTPDQRFGEVNAYPEEMLLQAVRELGLS